jgi:hypothetical protein
MSPIALNAAALIGHRDIWLLLSWGALATPLIAVLFFVFKIGQRLKSGFDP